MYEILSPIAQIVQNVPSCCLESITHGLEAVKGYLWCAHTAHVVAAVILEHVNTPASEAFGIILLMIKGSRFAELANKLHIMMGQHTKSCAGHLASTAVHAIFEALAVKMV